MVTGLIANEQDSGHPLEAIDRSGAHLYYGCVLNLGDGEKHFHMGGAEYFLDYLQRTQLINTFVYPPDYCLGESIAQPVQSTCYPAFYDQQQVYWG